MHHLMLPAPSAVQVVHMMTHLSVLGQRYQLHSSSHSLHSTSMDHVRRHKKVDTSTLDNSIHSWTSPNHSTSVWTGIKHHRPYNQESMTYTRNVCTVTSNIYVHMCTTYVYTRQGTRLVMYVLVMYIHMYKHVWYRNLYTTLLQIITGTIIHNSQTSNYSW